MDNDKIWAELDAIFSLPERMAGDIDAEQIAKRYGIGLTTARIRIRKMAESNEYILLSVHDATSANGRRNIIRKSKL